MNSSRDDEGVTTSVYTWEYDVFGNRLQEAPNLTTEDGECPVEAMEYGVANVLRRAVCASLNTVKAYGNDRAGSRLFQVDSADGFYQGVQALMTYTAKNQLYFSMTPTVQVGTYDYNWHWYDGQGLRVTSNVSSGSQYIPGDDPDPAVGTRSYYVYDGSDVQMMLTQSGGTWRVQQRLLTGGIDQALVGRFTNLQGTKRSLGLISDRQGTTLAAMRADGLQETQAIYFPRSPWGRQEGASGGGGNMNTQTGYTGAGTPNQTGGFTYLRNRWYDPATGRFLTQDPIGLTGGINLYAYAGNNPVSFSDPFGLMPCDPPDDPRCQEHETQGIGQGAALNDYIANGSNCDGAPSLCQRTRPPGGGEIGFVALSYGLGAIIGTYRSLRATRQFATRYMTPGEAAEVARTGTIPNVEEQVGPESFTIH